MVDLAMTSLLVPDYDVAISYFVDVLGFQLVEDTDLGAGKRWVVVAPSAGGAALLLARAVGDEQRARVGDQTGGRVAFFLATEDFHADHARLQAAGVAFTEAPRLEPYGHVVVFEDVFGNRWDLVERPPS